MVCAVVMLYTPRYETVSSVRWEAMVVTIPSGHLPRSEAQSEMKVFVRRGYSSMRTADGTAQVPERGPLQGTKHGEPMTIRHHPACPQPLPFAPAAPIKATKGLETWPACQSVAHNNCILL